MVPQIARDLGEAEQRTLRRHHFSSARDGGNGTAGLRRRREMVSQVALHIREARESARCREHLWTTWDPRQATWSARDVRMLADSVYQRIPRRRRYGRG